ncbi:MAG: hypothetical protein Q8916_03155 [Bacteroidota bacterium]|nr:hypothetical protein [Bacteroidota bacterium]MDP4229386.1 hypothetical protein [Bacteroidota bacterium]MDP4235182.1 hypothetical protein [Bacteroidota bacterium]
MKTRFSFFFLSLTLLGFFFTPTSGYCQRATSKNNDICLDFVDFLIKNTASIQYEWKGSSTQSWAIRAEYVAPGQGTSAFGVGGEMRFFFLDSRALEGFNIGPAVDAYFFKNNDLGKSKILFTVGADFAHKWFFDQFTVEPSVGLRYGITGSEVFPGIAAYTGTYLIGCLYLGYAW